MKVFGKFNIRNVYAKAVIQIVLALFAVIVASILVGSVIMPSIKLVVPLSEIQTYATKGFFSLLLISLSYLIYVKYCEKRQANELSFGGRNTLYAFCLGTTLISLTIIPLFALGYYEIVSHQPANQLFYVFVALSAQAIVAEVMYRGIFFRIIESHVGTVYSLIFVSIFFGLLNILVDGLNLMVMLSTMLVSALWCAIYILSRNLWVVGAMHASWLYTVFATGLLDEHWRSSSAIVSIEKGPSMLTGGVFGPEHSIITIIVVSICLYFVLRRAKAKGRFI